MAKKHIQNIYPRDRNALTTLAKCGYTTHEQLREFLRDKRISGYCKDGLIEKSVYSQPGSKGEDKTVYHLTSKGRDLCRRELSIDHIYSAQNPAHDLPLTTRYLSLTEHERATWKTETQCRDILLGHIRQLRNQGEEERAGELWEKMREGRISMPDALYTASGGVSMAFEVVTESYGQAEIEAKEEAAEALDAQIEFCRT